MDVYSAIIGGLIGAVITGGTAFVAFNSRLVKIETTLKNTIDRISDMEKSFEKQINRAEERWKEFMEHNFDQWQTVVNQLLREMPRSIGSSVGEAISKHFKK